MIEAAKQRFRALDPKLQWRLALGSLAVVGLGILWIFVANEPTDRRQEVREERESVQLTSDDFSGLELDALDSRVDGLEESSRSIEQRLEELTEQLEQQRREQPQADDSQLDPEVMERLNNLEEATRAIGEMAAEGREPGGNQAAQAPRESDAGETQGSASGGSERSDPGQEAQVDEGRVWQDLPQPVRETTGEGEEPSGGEEGQSARVGALQTYGGASASGQDEEEAAFAHLPAGSILSGELLAGLDAPTSQAAQDDPFPALIRVNKDAILPNRYRADVRECFIIAEAYGDLSSERAYMRGNTISCVRHDKSVVEKRMPLYVVGEDGKAGMRGRLVSKQGQVLTRAMMAGFLEGVANAFNVQRVPSLNLEGGQDSAEWEDMMGQEAAQSGVATGASRAMDRLAQFYIDMAQSMFPVIEIAAGRQVDLIVTRGQTLEPSGQGE